MAGRVSLAESGGDSIVDRLLGLLQSGILWVRIAVYVGWSTWTHPLRVLRLLTGITRGVACRIASLGLRTRIRIFEPRRVLRRRAAITILRHDG